MLASAVVSAVALAGSAPGAQASHSVDLACAPSCTITAGGSIDFHATVTEPSQVVGPYEWDLDGDKTTPPEREGFELHTTKPDTGPVGYPNAGRYTIRLRVTADDGAGAHTGYVERQIDVTPAAPQIDVTPAAPSLPLAALELFSERPHFNPDSVAEPRGQALAGGNEAPVIAVRTRPKRPRAGQLVTLDARGTRDECRAGGARLGPRRRRRARRRTRSGGAHRLLTGGSEPGQRRGDRRPRVDVGGHRGDPRPPGGATAARRGHRAAGTSRAQHRRLRAGTRGLEARRRRVRAEAGTPGRPSRRPRARDGQPPRRQLRQGEGRRRGVGPQLGHFLPGRREGARARCGRRGRPGDGGARLARVQGPRALSHPAGRRRRRPAREALPRAGRGVGAQRRRAEADRHRRGRRERAPALRAHRPAAGAGRVW